MVDSTFKVSATRTEDGEVPLKQVLLQRLREVHRSGVLQLNRLPHQPLHSCVNKEVYQVYLASQRSILIKDRLRLPGLFMLYFFSILRPGCTLQSYSWAGEELQ